MGCAEIIPMLKSGSSYCSALLHRIACGITCPPPTFSNRTRVNSNPGNDLTSHKTLRKPALDAQLTACRDCDLLQYEVLLDGDADAHCPRCNSVLYRGTRTGLPLMLALVIGCAVLLVISILFPIAVLEVRGAHVEATFLSTVVTVYEQGSELVAILVLLTTIVLPGLEIASLLYLLIPLAWGQIAPKTALVFRLVLQIHPWNMMEIMLLGVLVTLVKLTDFATIIPGVSLWSFCGLIVLFTAASSLFSVRDFWNWVEQRSDFVTIKGSLQ